MNNVVLSSPLVLVDGVVSRREIRLSEAIAFVTAGVENFCGHETVKILGLDPAQARKNCTGYDKALIVQPNKRLVFGREYTAAEIAKIGVRFVLLEKIYA